VIPLGDNPAGVPIAFFDLLDLHGVRDPVVVSFTLFIDHKPGSPLARKLFSRVFTEAFYVVRQSAQTVDSKMKVSPQGLWCSLP
jgi:hypothetical protein